MKNVLRRIREEFYKRLSAKTGWGKNEIMQLYNEVSLQIVEEELQGIKADAIPVPDAQLPTQDETKEVDYGEESPFYD